MAGVLSKFDANFHRYFKLPSYEYTLTSKGSSGKKITESDHKTLPENVAQKPKNGDSDGRYTSPYTAMVSSERTLTNEGVNGNRENRNRTDTANMRKTDSSNISQNSAETGKMSSERESSNRNPTENVTTRKDANCINNKTTSRDTRTDRGSIDRNQIDSSDTRINRSSSIKNQTDSIDARTERGSVNINQPDSADTRGNRNSSNRNQTDSIDTRRADSDRDSISRTTSNSDENKQSFSDRLGIVLYNPKYRQYATSESRLKSYENWQQKKKISVNVLVSAGFAYTGVDDSVRCFYCGGALRDWPDAADPWREHALNFPHCGHLRQCKGDAYIKHVRGEDDSDCEIDGDGNDVIDTVEVAIKRNKDAVMAARDFCTDENLIRCGIKKLLLEKDTFSGVDLVKVTEQIKEEIECKEESGKIAQAACLENDESSESETEADIVEENRKLKDPVMCKICFDAMACIITLPCGHMVCCSQCISALSKCAICRAQIKGTVRALMATYKSKL
ncbi:baculoviral IAP repeat-containing protein 3-like [Mercenaria mercenaria]|uniref:baculoviral IAP repeat-containing protein 3-like n=1 Tax=Mercenaria mercenaria TaxID=6596 RepID=UPI00234EBDE8|nr:baculoviral IAP repeat-containing protein 3-like [Mercenaria mercenaria]